MANIKLTNDYWETSGIYDITQSKTQRQINSDVNGALGGKAPTNHASTATTYGKGTSSNYGHVKISDSLTDTTTAATGGVVPSMKAVSDLNGALTSAEKGLAIIVTGDTCSTSVPSNGYAYIKNNTHGLAEGLYRNKTGSAFPTSGGTANSTVFEAVSGGGLNSVCKVYTITGVTMPATAGAKLFNITNYGVVVPNGKEYFIAAAFVLNANNNTYYQLPIGMLGEYPPAAYCQDRSGNTIDLRLSAAGETAYGGQPVILKILVI